MAVLNESEKTVSNRNDATYGYCETHTELVGQNIPYNKFMMYKFSSKYFASSNIVNDLPPHRNMNLFKALEQSNRASIIFFNDKKYVVFRKGDIFDILETGVWQMSNCGETIILGNDSDRVTYFIDSYSMQKSFFNTTISYINYQNKTFSIKCSFSIVNTVFEDKTIIM